MESLVVINACMREESRTQKILDGLLGVLGKKYNIEIIDLSTLNMSWIGEKDLKDRDNGYVPEKFVSMSKKVANADRLVIAAPFWDMSFPSVLKVFFENISLFNITFTSTQTECVGLCKAKKVLYITTRGMNIKTGDPLEQATPYIKALSKLWGLGELYVLSAENLDYSSDKEIESKVEAAIAQGVELCKTF
ncbi:MAG: NAD(P)H-dependent oxidoreductase [Bacteroidales bacterium]|jgi:FMN-dependent NADH-azoreductase|nr:NAD(P)H-dependent oxidoreductase [Bacteroidales bacterium]